MQDSSTVIPAVGVQARERLIRHRRRLWSQAQRFVRDHGILPPLSRAELLCCAEELAGLQAVAADDGENRKVLALMIHNAAWRETFASIPFERRVLLLPQCLRSRDDCRAEADAYGLLCRECGQCPLGRVQREAIDLGYVVLIAEGAAAVAGLLKDGEVEAVIGAGCLDALEETFPHLAAEAIPSVAVPLLWNGCNATDLDLEFLLDHIRLARAPSPAPRRSIEAWREQVRGWFTPEKVADLIQPERGHAMSLAIEWLCADGKRWRPLLAAVVHEALADSPGGEDSALIRHVAIAAECFHKASLIHDDIEDNDTLRYGRPTLHCAHGIPAALNAGDLLLGEGYRLLSHCPVEPDVRLRMLAVASDAHRRLCLGQGEELEWRREPVRMGLAGVLDLFRLKTAPAFEVAILLGAISGGADEQTCEALSAFSQAMGVAYQIRDDLQDAADEARHGDHRSPSILFGLLCERCTDAECEDVLRALRRQTAGEPDSVLRSWSDRYGLVQAAVDLQAVYRTNALQALAPIRSIALRSVLTRLVKRILP